MRKIKEKAAAVIMAAAMLLSGCSSSEKSVDSGSSANNANPDISSFTGGEDENSKPEPVSNTQPDAEATLDTETADIPETDVTDASEFNCNYNSDLGGMVIYSYLGSSSVIHIPDTIGGEPVTAIGSAAFYYGNSSEITRITIPDSVTSIDSNAFDSCSSLTSINIPDGVTVIRYNTFSGCTSLTSVTIPDSVTAIEFCAFLSCSSLASITIPDSVTEVGDNAFNGCENIKATYKGVTYDYDHISDLYSAINGD